MKNRQGNSSKHMDELVEDTLLEQYDKYYRIAYSYVHNKEDAMDVVQEGAYKAILNCDKLQEEKFTDTWICRIMINEAMTLLRKKKEMPKETEQMEQGKEDDYSDIDLTNAIEKLSLEEQTMIRLHYYEDMTLLEVARVMEKNVNTVKSRLYRAIDKLGVELS